jgi:hypothetical protein
MDPDLVSGSRGNRAEGPGKSKTIANREICGQRPRLKSIDAAVDLVNEFRAHPGFTPVVAVAPRISGDATV